MASTSFSNALKQSLLGEAHVDKLRRMAPPSGPHALVVRPGGGDGVPQPRRGEVVTFAPFLSAGLIPPFSEFFLVVLSFYGIHLAHLVPNSIIMLSTFVHLCEMFLGITPNLALFRHLYSLRNTASRHTVGSCSFRLRDAASYIPMPLKDKWEAWGRQWLFVEAETSLPNLEWPAKQAEWQESWSEAGEETHELIQVMARLRFLREAGLTGAMVIGDFVERRISPLHRRERMACFYTGKDDITRTWVGGNVPASLF